MWVKKNTLFPSPFFNKEFVNPFLLAIIRSFRKTLGCLRQKWKLQEWWTPSFFSQGIQSLLLHKNFWGGGQITDVIPPPLLKQNDVRIDPLYHEDDTPVTVLPPTPLRCSPRLSRGIKRHQKAIAQTFNDAMAQDKLFHGASSDSKWHCVTCHHSNGSLTTTDQLINAFCFNSISTKI